MCISEAEASTTWPSDDASLDISDMFTQLQQVLSQLQPPVFVMGSINPRVLSILAAECRTLLSHDKRQISNRMTYARALELEPHFVASESDVYAC